MTDFDLTQRTIWKFPVNGPGSILVEMPRGARLLSVHTQFEGPCLWAAVDPSASKVKRRLFVIGTGHMFPAEDHEMRFDSFVFVGTFFLQGGALVFHVFDAGEAP